MSPELLVASADEDISGYDKKPSWDVAVRFQDLKRLLSIPEKEKKRLEKRAIAGVLAKAKSILGVVARPEKTQILDVHDLQTQGKGRGDWALLETFEESLGQGIHPLKEVISKDAYRFESKVEKQQDVLLLLDASLSMTGEKIALLAVATAVVSFAVPMKRLAIIAFASDTKFVKKFDEEISMEDLIQRVLGIPSHGLTNLEKALDAALTHMKDRDKAHGNVILVSDGKYTEGKDPSFLGSKFKHLHALKLGRDIAGRALLYDLIRLGNGQFFEARKIHDLPKVMYNTVRSLLR